MTVRNKPVMLIMGSQEGFKYRSMWLTCDDDDDVVVVVVVVVLPCFIFES